jgi:hypothetical protein
MSEAQERCGLVRRSRASGLTSIGSILLAGAPTGDVDGWAVHHLLDTAVACGLALLAIHLLWPSDEEEEVPVPVPT